MAKKKRRTKTAHSGVVVVKAGDRGYRLKWRDAATGNWRWASLRHKDVTSKEDAEREAHKKLAELEEERRELKIGVVGLPKTIDNDIPLIDKSFGEMNSNSLGQALAALGVEL